MEYARNNRDIAVWEPFTWEYSSGIAILLLIPLLLAFDRRFPLTPETWKRHLGFHVLATIPFSLCHVGLMVWMRKLVYALNQGFYDFGDLPFELFYEFRKDFLSYVFILAVIYGYRFYRAKTSGAAYSQEDTQASPRFLIKKNGQTLKVTAHEVDWIEAAGNYVLLHVGSQVHPLRDTMKGIGDVLGPRFFRCHRSSIVNLDRVTGTKSLGGGKMAVILSSGETIPCNKTASHRLIDLMA